MRNGGLTAAEAAARSAVVSVTSYDVTLDLTGVVDGSSFSSRSVVDFSYDGTGGPGITWIDLVAESVESIVLDGVALDPDEVMRGDRLRLGPLGGRHRLDICAHHRPGTGQGLSRTADGGAVHVWSQFQAYDARRAFACFDQPDLKAAFSFEVRAPLDWHCVSNRREVAVVEDGDSAVWTFPPTTRLPTYSTAVCAGPFHVVRSDRMALFARRALAEPLERNAGEIFDLSRRALVLFEDAFGIEFDGDSYDYVFLPDQPGAMENHGCVTWNDQVLYRSEPTAEQRRRRALVLLHEMSHMWFGNLVTPQWWDGLWLSESFADWAALWAASQLGVLDSRWSVATALEKERAADADLLSSTHPVSRPVPDIAAAEANFDVITYAKGACLLRQLVTVAGEEAFFEGLRKYFAQYAGANGSLPALIAAVQPFTSVDLTEWSRVWLETSGINTLSLVDGKLIQDGVMRPHSLSIGLYAGAPLAEVGRFEVEVDGESTDLPDVDGVPLVLLDDRDSTYAILRPDPQSVRTLVSAGAELTDPIARHSARRTLRGLLRDGLLPASDVVEYVAASVTTEPDPIHLKALTNLATEAILHTAPTHRPTQDRKLAIPYTTALTTDCAHPAGVWGRLVLVEGLAEFADSGEQLELVDLLLADPDLPQPLRWRLLTRLVALGFAGSEQIDTERDRDPDPDADWHAAAVRAATPAPTAKDTALDLLFTAPASIQPTVGAALWHPRHTTILGTRPLTFLDRLIDHPDPTTAARTARHAFPLTAATPALITRTQHLAATRTLAPVLTQTLQSQAELTRRALTSRTS